MRKNANLAVVNAQNTEENTLADRRREERCKIKADKKEFRRAVNRLIEEIEDRLIDSAFSLERGVGSVDDDVMSTLEPLLEPEISFDRKFLEEGFEQLTENEVSRAQADALSNLQWNLRKTYFYAGLLAGARLKGASIEELRKLGERWMEMWFRGKPWAPVRSASLATLQFCACLSQSMILALRPQWPYRAILAPAFGKTKKLHTSLPTPQSGYAVKASNFENNHDD
jgi:hypothetical protein